MYNTSMEAARGEHLNESTILMHCNNPDSVFTRNTKLGKKGQTKREAGFYRITGEHDGTSRKKRER